jgi:hypothetical protein
LTLNGSEGDVKSQSIQKVNEMTFKERAVSLIEAVAAYLAIRIMFA